MKTDIRKVTIEQEVYIAEDGAEFDDANDCECYEARLVGKRLKMYTSRYVKTDTVENRYLVKLDSWTDAKDFIELCRFDGINSKGIAGPGVYLYIEGTYSGGKEAWTNISEIISKVEEASNDQREDRV